MIIGPRSYEFWFNLQDRFAPCLVLLCGAFQLGKWGYPGLSPAGWWLFPWENPQNGWEKSGYLHDETDTFNLTGSFDHEKNRLGCPVMHGSREWHFFSENRDAHHSGSLSDSICLFFFCTVFTLINQQSVHLLWEANRLIKYNYRQPQLPSTGRVTLLVN